MNVILVLLWKHFLVRRQRCIMTAVRYIWAPFCFYLLFVVVKAERAEAKGSQKLLEEEIGPSLVVYSPSNNWTDALMQRVGRSIKSSILRESDMEKLENLQSKQEVKYNNPAYVYFHGTEREMPKILNYTISMKKQLNKVPDAPRMVTEVDYKSFLRLKWAIDSAYLESIRGSPVNLKLYVEEVPLANKVTSSDAEFYGAMIKISAIFSLYLFTSRLGYDRINGVKELIKMTGVSSWMIDMAEFLDLIPEALVYSISGAFFSTGLAKPFLLKTNAGLVFIILFMYFTYAMFMAFMCSFILNDVQYLGLLALIMFLYLDWPAEKLIQNPLQPFVMYFYPFLLGGPLFCYTNSIEVLESNDDGLNFSNMWMRHGNSGPMYLALLSLIVYCIIFYIIGVYLGCVNPGPVGTAKKWNFFLQKSFWSKKRDTHLISEDEEDTNIQEPAYFEKPPSDAVVRLRIIDVTKVYGNRQVLSHVTLDTYNGEILVVLGHNGAGKTTLMSIISGMTSATRGQLYLDGVNIITQTAYLRKQIGICPQHNIVINQLTTKQNIRFFAMLKGQSCKKAKESSVNLLDQLKLMDRASYKSEELSGGMKRRLQLACALAGDSTVLLLDEPTSGLDVETRRELWDMMRSLRVGRTVLLSTHYMEEADALGDRVAAIHQGHLRCHATPMFLKTQIGSGYSLTVNTKGLPKTQEITSTITSVIPSATLARQDFNNVTFSIPTQEMSKAPNLFSKLEGNQESLAIISMGLGVISLEEVFLNMCSDTTMSFTADDMNTSAPEPEFEMRKGFALCRQQFCILLKRHLLYLWGSKIMFLIMQILLPVLIFVLVACSIRIGEEESYQNPNPVPGGRRYSPQVFLNYKGQNGNRRSLSMPNRTYLDNVELKHAEDVRQAILNTTKYQKSNKRTAGVEINDTAAKVIYSDTDRNVAPASIDVLSNLLAEARGGVQTHDKPLADSTGKIYPSKELGFIFGHITMTSFVIFSVFSNASEILLQEKRLGTRHIHMMSGCSPIVIWAAVLCTDSALYCTFLVIPYILTFLLDYTGVLRNIEFLFSLALLLIVATFTFLALIYLMSLCLDSTNALSMLLTVLGLIAGLGKFFLQVYPASGGTFEFFAKILSPAVYCVPTATTVVALMCLCWTASNNGSCYLNLHLCPVIDLVYPGCCQSKNGPYSYFGLSEKFGIGIYILCLIVQFFVLMGLVILTEYGYLKWLHHNLFDKLYKPPAKFYSDPLVKKEEEYVTQAFSERITETQHFPDAILVDDLHKRYFRTCFCCKEMVAVKGVSFSVKKGECFGLLGVNGAGKSTTFKMITAETMATRGRIFGNGQDLKFPQSKIRYLKSLGYCPQFFGLDNFLTGAENLRVILTLRGYKKDDIEKLVDTWIIVASLEKYRDLPVRTYSGGCTRRMATVAALASGAQVTLLDEPTSGVDVAARRRVWLALKKGLRNNRSIIITSHSMDEMEALCSRVAIMARGEIACVGAPSELKAAYGVGHSVRFKIQAALDEAGVIAVEELKQTIQNTFNCSAKDQHSTVLEYHINETMQYSDLFTKLEALKLQFSNVIENYNVTATSLEEVFLSFAHTGEPRAKKKKKKKTVSLVDVNK